MKIDFSAFINNLQYMAKGMLGIFIVTLIIIIAVIILNKTTSK